MKKFSLLNYSLNLRMNKPKNKNISRIFCAIALNFLLQFGYSQDRFATSEGTVLFDGYDPVGFFTKDILKGKTSISTLFKGRFIYFTNERNKERFLENKEKYFPGYGGWCAIAMTDGIFVLPDYTMYKIQDGQLLFFRRKAYFNGLTLWDKNPENNKMKADLQYNKYF
ncbi:MAG: YHS domain-containing protein [Cyclobacteriaceae bacterium]|jgi:YHS domain-containing protein